MLGLLYCYNGEIGKGRRTLLKAIKLSPSQAKYYYYLGLTLLGARGMKEWIRLTTEYVKIARAAAPEITSVMDK